MQILEVRHNDTLHFLDLHICDAYFCIHFGEKLKHGGFLFGYYSVKYGHIQR